MQVTLRAYTYAYPSIHRKYIFLAYIITVQLSQCGSTAEYK